MTATTNEWLEYAENDFVTAQQLLQLNIEPVLGAVCFHSQQCIEKLMKALLVKNNQAVPKVHDLVKLEKLILPFAQDWASELQDLSYLTEAVIEFRYPGDPATREDAANAFEACCRLRKQLLIYFKEH